MSQEMIGTGTGGTRLVKGMPNASSLDTVRGSGTIRTPDGGEVSARTDYIIEGLPQGARSAREPTIAALLANQNNIELYKDLIGTDEIEDEEDYMVWPPAVERGEQMDVCYDTFSLYGATGEPAAIYYAARKAVWNARHGRKTFHIHAVTAAVPPRVTDQGRMANLARGTVADLGQLAEDGYPDEYVGGVDVPWLGKLIIWI